MSQISFMTPITYPMQSTWVGMVDDYFHIGDEKAFVMQADTAESNARVVFYKAPTSLTEKIVKIATYITIIIPLIMFAAKTALRMPYSYIIVDPRQELEKGMKDFEFPREQVQEAVTNKATLGCTKFQSRRLVFALDDAPGYVYKKAKPKRFELMLEAQKICLIYNLSRLQIPSAKMFKLSDDSHIIVEQKLSFKTEERDQEALYMEAKDDFTETARQLAVFVAKTGFCDVAPRNIPILESENRVGLIDLEHMHNPNSGFVGSHVNRSRGLIYCVGENQLQTVIDIAQQSGAITETEAIDHKTERSKQLERYKTIKDSIVDSAADTIDTSTINWSAVGIDCDQTIHQEVFCGKGYETHPFSIGTIAEFIVDEINTLITANAKLISPAIRRRVLLVPDNKQPLETYMQITTNGNRYKYPGAEGQELVVDCILEALKNAGHIHSYKYDYRNCIEIQA